MSETQARRCARCKKPTTGMYGVCTRTPRCREERRKRLDRVSQISAASGVEFKQGSFISDEPIASATAAPVIDEVTLQLERLQVEYDYCRRYLWNAYGNRQPDLEYYNVLRTNLDRWFSTQRARIVDGFETFDWPLKSRVVA